MKPREIRTPRLRLGALRPEDRERVKNFVKVPRGRRFWIGGLLHGMKMWRITELYNELMFRLPMIRQAESHSRNGGKAFVYYWQEPSKVRFRGACHAAELIYVFGNLTNTIYNGEPGDAEVSRKVQAMWTRFAKTGDPGLEELPWPAYTEKDRTTMVLEKHCHTEQDVLKEQRELLSPLLDYRLCPSYEDLSYNVPFLWKRIGIVSGIVLLIAAVLVVIGLTH